jgi:prepilin-type N-terminal cleavage/methylation domain-containing protein
MGNPTSKRGFSLPEVMVAMTVMVLVVLAASNLLVSSMRSNASNVNTLIAYGLAQEGLEAARNIRDSDWLLGATFNGNIGSVRNRTAVWGVTLPSAANDMRYYTVNSNDSNNSLFSSAVRFQMSQLPGVAPWKLTELSREDVEDGRATRLYKKENGVSPGEVRYTHASAARLTVSRRITVSPYHRYLEVTPVEYQVAAGSTVTPAKKLRVACIVEWEEFGRKRQVRLETELTDWKK